MVLPTHIPRTAAKRGTIAVPLYLAPWTVPNTHGTWYFDPASQLPAIQFSDGRAFPYAAWRFKVGMPNPVALTFADLNPGGANIGTLNPNFSPTFLAGWLSYHLETTNPSSFTSRDTWMMAPCFYGYDVVIPAAPVGAAVTVHNAGGNVVNFKPLIMAYLGDFYFAAFSTDITKYQLELWNASNNGFAVPDYFEPLGTFAFRYPISAVFPKVDLQHSWLLSLANAPYTTVNTIADPQGNIVYDISLDHSSDDNIFQNNAPNFLGQGLAPVVPGGYLLGYSGIASTHYGYTQQATIFILSPDGSEYVELALVPEVSVAGQYLAHSGGDWTMAIDPFGVLYMSNGYDNTRALISYAFNIPFQSPTIAWPNLPSFPMPCYNPCAAIPIGV